MAAAGIATGCEPRELREGEIDGPSVCPTGVASLSIHPAGTLIDVGDGQGAEPRFRATALAHDGSVVAVAPRWWTSAPLAGVVRDDGLFEASGEMGGEVRIAAAAGGSVAQTTLTLALARRFPADIAPEVVRLFDDAHPRAHGASAPRLLAPEDGARFSEAAPPELRWDGPDTGWFRARFLSGAATVSFFTRERHFVVGADAARMLAASNRGRTYRVLVEWAEPGAEAVLWNERSIELRSCEAGEICDGTDDDCDGVADDGCVEATPFEGRLPEEEDARCIPEP